MSRGQPVPDHRVERALVVAAHPDDVDFGAAGTVASWTDAGVAVTYCIVTDGQAGGFDLSVSRDAMVGIRRDLGFGGGYAEGFFVVPTGQLSGAGGAPASQAHDNRHQKTATPTLSTVRPSRPK